MRGQSPTTNPQGCPVNHATKYYNVQIRITACFLRSMLTRATVAFCNYSTLVGGNCGPSSENPANVECITISQCTKEVNGHLKFCKVSDDVGVDSESKLLLARAGRVSVYYSPN